MTNFTNYKSVLNGQLILPLPNLPYIVQSADLLHTLYGIDRQNISGIPSNGKDEPWKIQAKIIELAHSALIILTRHLATQIEPDKSRNLCHLNS